MRRGILRPVVLLAAMLAAIAGVGGIGATALEAQEDEREPEPQRPTAPDTTPTQAEAAPIAPAIDYVPPRYAVSLSVGRPGFGALQGQPVLARRRNLSGEVLDSATLSREIEAEGGVQVNVAGVASLGPAWAVRVGVELGRARLRTEYDGDSEIFLAAADALARDEPATLSVLAVDAALRLRIPSTHRAQPYLELGGSAMEWRAEGAPAGAEALGAGVRRVAVIGAVGAVIPVNAWLSGQLQVTTRVARTPLDPAGAGAAGPSSSTLAVVFQPPVAEDYLDSSHALTSALRLDVGVSVRFGTAGARPRDRSGEDDATPPPSR